MNTLSNELFLWQSLAIFLLLWAMLGVVVAVLLITQSDWLVRINRWANRWVSTRGLGILMDHSISLEHWFYQHHRVFGGAVVAGALCLFVYFSAFFDKTAALRDWGRHYSPQFVEAGLDALVLSVFCGAALALIVGVFLWLRPSLLRGMEGRANQWVSLRHFTKPLDTQHGNLDQFVLRHARRMGWMLLLGSLSLLALLIKIAL